MVFRKDCGKQPSFIRMLMQPIQDLMLTRMLLIGSLSMRMTTVRMGKPRRKWWGKRRRRRMPWRGATIQQNRNFTFNDLKQLLSLCLQ